MDIALNTSIDHGIWVNTLSPNDLGFVFYAYGGIYRVSNTCLWHLPKVYPAFGDQSYWKEKENKKLFCASTFRFPFQLNGSSAESENPNFIANIQSPEQQELLAEHNPIRPLYVEGAFHLWLRSTKMTYFVLRGDPFAVDEDELKTEGRSLIAMWINVLVCECVNCTSSLDL